MSDKGIPKMCKILNSRYDFLRAYTIFAQKNKLDKSCIIGPIEGAKYVFHENWFQWQKTPYLRMSKPPSNQI